MMELKDWLSFFAGVAMIALGGLPLIHSIMSNAPSAFALSWFPLTLFTYVLAGAGLYLLIDAIIEITNSNGVGWMTFLLGIVFLIIGLIPILNTVGIIGFSLPFALSPVAYQIMFVIEGIFLCIATFAMEL
jgi:hypothetical protein